MLKTIYTVILTLLLIATGIMTWQFIKTENTLNETQTILTSTQEKLKNTLATLDENTKDLTSIKAKLNVTEATLTTTQATLENNRATLSSTKDELSDAESTLSKMQSVLDSAQAQIDKIQGKYPLKFFTSVNQLRLWTSAHLKVYDWYDSLTEFQSAVSIMHDAMLDGYFVWLDYDIESNGTQTYCMAFAGDNLYWWFPHSQYYDGVHLINNLYK